MIVAGHTNCGGVAAAYDIACQQMKPIPADRNSSTQQTPLSRWLTPLVKLAIDLKLPPAPPEEALPLLLRASVKQQVENVCNSGVKPRKAPVHVHGWIYELETGLLHDLKITRPL